MTRLVQQEAYTTRGHIFVYYYIFRSEIHVFGIRAGEAVPHYARVREIAVEALESELKYSYSMTLSICYHTKPSEHFWTKYSTLIEPIATWTRPGEIICFIPYGMLHDLPLHALHIDEKPLIARNPVYYNPSLSIWEQLQQKDNNASLWNSPFVMADPEHNLPYAIQEAESLVGMLNTDMYTGDQVVKSLFLEHFFEASLIHFAGHGVYHYEGEKKPGLRLANQEFISAQEISNLKTKASLVVLSACESGLHHM
jgi:CHAT domain-containing protein